MNTANKNIPNTYHQLYRLENEEDWKVHHNDIDIRDFKVKTQDGKTIGEVENLLVDLEDKIVRYVEIELDDKIPTVDETAVGSYTERDGDRIIIVPVGLVDIDSDENLISVKSLKEDHFRFYPRYGKKAGGFNADYEYKLHQYLIGPAGNPAAYKDEDVEENTDQGTEYVGGAGVQFRQNNWYKSPYFRDSKYREAAHSTSFTRVI